MRLTHARRFMALAAALLTLVFASTPIAAQRTDSAHVLVTYHSVTGYTRHMAEAVAMGARTVEGVRVTLLPIDSVSTGLLESADGIVVGSPVHWANMSAEVKRFIDGWPFLQDRIGAAFATGGGDTGGKEHVVVSLLLAMLNHGMVVAGPLYDDGGFRYGTYGASADTGAEPPGNRELDDAHRLGERIARLALTRSR